MRKLPLIVVVMAVLLLSSCDMRREIYPNLGVIVELNLDWSELSKATKSQIDAPDGATVIFFPTDGSAAYTKLTNYTFDKISLPAGEYNVLVFNETVVGHDYLIFSGTDKYETFTAEWEDVELSAKYSRSGTSETSRAVTQTADLLLVARLEGYQITSQMVVEQEVQTLTFVPQLVTGSMKMTVHIVGMDNVSSVNPSYLYVDGMALGYNLGTASSTTTETTHLVELSNMEFDENSYQNGTMSQEFYTFGDAITTTKAEGLNRATFRFNLRNGTTMDDVVFDITDEIESQTLSAELSALVSVDVDIELGSDLTGGSSNPNENPIYIEDVPDTESSTTGSGFDTDVSEWGEEVILPLPLS